MRHRANSVCHQAMLKIMGAKHIIGIDPVEPRRKVSIQVCLRRGSNRLPARRQQQQRRMSCKRVKNATAVLCAEAVRLQMGCADAVDPSGAVAAVAAATGGRGADIVLEMVGHVRAPSSAPPPSFLCEHVV